MTHSDILAAAGLTDAELTGGSLAVTTPVDGSEIARLKMHTPTEAAAQIAAAKQAFHAWRTVPAPRRGELVRLLGEELRREKENLGRLVTLECGKILQEGLGEVQEMIDICDFAVGLSRQLYGLTIASERPGHSMRETWHPMGPCRHHYRVQLPCCAVVLECRLGAGLRRSGDLETIREDAFDRFGRARDL